MTTAHTSQTPQTPAGTPRSSFWLQLGVISASEFVVWAGFGAIIPYLPEPGWKQPVGVVVGFEGDKIKVTQA